jgi:hypothetical protein
LCVGVLYPWLEVFGGRGCVDCVVCVMGLVGSVGLVLGGVVFLFAGECSLSQAAMVAPHSARRESGKGKVALNGEVLAQARTSAHARL